MPPEQPRPQAVGRGGSPNPAVSPGQRSGVRPAVEVDAVAGADADESSLADTAVDIRLEDALDAMPGTAEEADAGETGALAAEYDPEAGHSNVRERRAKITEALTSNASLFVMGAVAALAGVGSIIFAVTMQTRPYLIAAGVIAPPSFVFFFLRWRRWMDSAPYIYRLLRELGEVDSAEAYLEQRFAKQRRKLGLAEGESAEAGSPGAPSPPKAKGPRKAG